MCVYLLTQSNATKQLVNVLVNWSAHDDDFNLKNSVLPF